MVTVTEAVECLKSLEDARTFSCRISEDIEDKLNSSMSDEARLLIINDIMLTLGVSRSYVVEHMFKMKKITEE